MAARKKLPKAARWWEATRRTFGALARDLRPNAPKVRTRISGRDTATSSHQWPRCPTCHHRVPELCGYCLQARAGVTEHHTLACCPGPCVMCGRCEQECPGQCPGCSGCLDHCPGHKETHR